MLNSVGLQGPGVEAWRRARAAGAAGPGSDGGGQHLGAHRRGLRRGRRGDRRRAPSGWSRSRSTCPVRTWTAAPTCSRTIPRPDRGRCWRSPRSAGRPRWAKLSPNTDRLVEVAAAAAAAGAEAVTLVNTVMGMVIDTETRRPVLGRSQRRAVGPGHPPGGGPRRPRCARRAARRSRSWVSVAWPRRSDAVELMLAGASAVQVGTASFADPRSVITVLDGMEAWCRRHGVTRVASLTGQVQQLMW